MNRKSWIQSILLFAITLPSQAQVKTTFIKDTLYFDGYKGINFDARYITNFNRGELAHRFKPDSNSVKRAEVAIKQQYIKAVKRYLYLEYWYDKHDIENIPAHEWRKRYKEKKAKLIPLEKKRIANEYTIYDRQYFGFITPKGAKYILIDFVPHKPEYFEDGGESHLRTLPELVFNALTHVLSYAGWTGKAGE